MNGCTTTYLNEQTYMAITIKKRTRVLLLLVVAAALYAGSQIFQKDVAPRPEAAVAENVVTAHYVISSTATAAQTLQIAEAVEHLHTAYLNFFPLKASATLAPKLQLILYKDQAQFKEYNRAASWAEAYYLPPNCHAYFAADEKNPYHWMLHEATHQLNHQVARIADSKWINEGLASYFGTSAVKNGKLIPGLIDFDTYPMWAVARLKLTGDLDTDLGSGKIIALRAIVTGAGGPQFAEKVNTYYVGYWSLSHFLFHYQGGVYAEKYRALIVAGGTIEDFERLIGPIEKIQSQWYGYLEQQVASARLNKAHPASY